MFEKSLKLAALLSAIVGIMLLCFLSYTGRVPEQKTGQFCSQNERIFLKGNVISVEHHNAATSLRIETTSIREVVVFDNETSYNAGDIVFISGRVQCNANKDIFADKVEKEIK